MDFPSFSQPLTNTIARVAARPRSESFSLRHDEGAARARRIKSEMVSASITIRCSVTHKSQPDVPRWLVWSSYITLRSRESDLLDVDLRHSRRGVTDNLFLGPQTPRAVKFKTLFCEHTENREKRAKTSIYADCACATRTFSLAIRLCMSMSKTSVNVLQFSSGNVVFGPLGVIVAFMLMLLLLSVPPLSPKPRSQLANFSQAPDISHKNHFPCFPLPRRKFFRFFPLSRCFSLLS